MSNEVKVVMSAEDARLVAAWREARRGPQQFGDELDRVAQRGRRAGKATKDAFAEAGSVALGVAQGITGIGSAVSGILTLAKLLRDEWDAMIAREKSAMDRQVDVGAAHKRAFAAARMGGAEFTPDQMYERIVRGAHGRDPTGMFLTAESAFNVAGDIAPEKVMETITAAAKMRPDLGEEEFKQTVLGSLQLQKEFGVSPEKAVAGALQSSTAAAPESMAEYAKYMLPGIVQMRAFGTGKESFEDLAAIAIGTGMRAGDTTGRRTMTNLINVLKQVREEALVEGLIDEETELPEMLERVRGSEAIQSKLLGVFAKETGKKPEELLEEMRMHQKGKGGNFGGELVGEARMFVPIMELLSPGENRTKKEIEAAKKKVTGLNEEAVKAVEQANQEFLGSKHGGAAQVARMARQAESELLLEDPAGGRQALVSLMEKTRLGLHNQPGLDRKLKTLGDQLTTGPISPTELRRIAGKVEAEQTNVAKFGHEEGLALTGKHGEGLVPLPPEMQSPNQARQIAVLERLEQALLQMAAAQEEANANRDKPIKVEPVGRDAAVQPQPPPLMRLRDGWDL